MTDYATSWFVRNSQTPSEAMTMILSWSKILNFLISGSGMTPYLWANPSPIDQLIARPGISLSGAQTQNGPMSLPSSSLKVSITPLHFSIRARSKGMQGLWSVVNCKTFTRPSSLTWTEIALESPRFAVYKVFPWKKTEQQVEPLKCTCSWLKNFPLKTSESHWIKA